MINLWYNYIEEERSASPKSSFNLFLFTQLYRNQDAIYDPSYDQ